MLRRPGGPSRSTRSIVIGQRSRQTETRNESPPNPMTYLDSFGLLAVSLMLLFYALEKRHALYVLAFAGACALGSVYGFLQGAWPFGVIEAIWALVAANRWRGLTRVVC